MVRIVFHECKNLSSCPMHILMSRRHLLIILTVRYITFVFLNRNWFYFRGQIWPFSKKYIKSKLSVEFWRILHESFCEKKISKVYFEVFTSFVHYYNLWEQWGVTLAIVANLAFCKLHCIKNIICVKRMDAVLISWRFNLKTSSLNKTSHFVISHYGKKNHILPK